MKYGLKAGPWAVGNRPWALGPQPTFTCSKTPSLMPLTNAFGRTDTLGIE